MALVKDNPLIPAVADVKVFAISLTNADSLLKLGGANGLPYNNPAAQLIGTTIAGGVTPTTGIALLTGANSFVGTQTTTKGNGYGWVSLSGIAGIYSGIGVGRVAVDGSVIAIGAAGQAFAGTVPGDICLVGLGAANLWLGTTGSPGALKLLANGEAQALGDLKVATLGKGIFVKTGANATIGTVVLNGTTPVVVNTNKVTALTNIQLTTQAASATYGTPVVASRVAGSTFSVKSTIAGDTSTVGWVFFEPIP